MGQKSKGNRTINLTGLDIGTVNWKLPEELCKVLDSLSKMSEAVALDILKKQLAIQMLTVNVLIPLLHEGDPRETYLQFAAIQSRAAEEIGALAQRQSIPRLN